MIITIKVKTEKTRFLQPSWFRSNNLIVQSPRELLQQCYISSCDSKVLLCALPFLLWCLILFFPLFFVFVVVVCVFLLLVFISFFSDFFFVFCSFPYCFESSTCCQLLLYVLHLSYYRFFLFFSTCTYLRPLLFISSSYLSILSFSPSRFPSTPFFIPEFSVQNHIHANYFNVSCIK